MSVAADIADAVVTAVEALALTGVTVVRRKTPSLPPGVSPPQVVVSVGEEGDTDYLTATLCLVTYPVSVTVVTAAGGKKLVDDDTLRGWREQIRGAVDAKTAFAAVSEFNAVHSGGRAPFDPAALAKDLNYSTQTFTVEAIEARS